MPTLYDQTVTTYTDTTPHVRVISDVIKMISPRDTPLLAALGGLDAARNKFKINQNGYKIEILEDELDPLTGTCAHTTTIATDDTNFPVDDASAFQDGHVILIDSEYMVVKTIDATNNTITVYSRSYGGTNATHASTSAIEIVGMARLEGDDADYGPVVDISAPYNYTGIFQKGLKVTGTLQKIAQYGITNEFDYQASKALPGLMRLIEKSAFHGVRAAGSAAAPRSFGGIGTFVTGNSVNAGGGIAQTDVDNVMEYVMTDGGNPDLFVCHPSIANDLKALIDSSSFVRLNYENQQIGMLPVNRISTQYGQLQILMSRWCPTSKAFVLDSSKVGFYTLRPFGWEDIAKTGDSKKAEVVGEFSFLVANADAHGYIYGLTT